MARKKPLKPWTPGKPQPKPSKECFSARWFQSLPLAFHLYEAAVEPPYSQLSKLRGPR